MSNPVKLPFALTDWQAALGFAIAVVAVVVLVRKLPIPAAIKP